MYSHVEDIRRFNRFYTKQIGVLHEGLLESRFSLAEARVLYELAHRENPTATELGKDLGLDQGYLSRILAGFQKSGIVAKKRGESDARQHHLRLTAKGRAAFAPLDQRARQDVAAMLERIAQADQKKLVGAMATIERLLGGAPSSGEPYLLRPHEKGDMGWVVHRQSVLYAQEYGWNEEFEALVSEIVAKFLRNFDPKRERCWIAERDGEIVGSVFLVRRSAKIAQLRMLYVEKSARGLGIGKRLVAECIRFARQCGYSKITLWTNDVLVSARRIYEAAGFKLVHQERQRNFGHDLVSQNWDLEL